MAFQSHLGYVMDAFQKNNSLYLPFSLFLSLSVSLTLRIWDLASFDSHHGRMVLFIFFLPSVLESVDLVPHVFCWKQAWYITFATLNVYVAIASGIGLQQRMQGGLTVV